MLDLNCIFNLMDNVYKPGRRQDQGPVSHESQGLGYRAVTEVKPEVPDCCRTGVHGTLSVNVIAILNFGDTEVELRATR